MFNCVGLKLGNYRLVRLVGHGGFADVYLGVHVYLKTEAAIKVLHTRLPDKVLQKFLAEACNHARLNHPNIVHVLDFGIENTIPYLAMHYAAHGTLRQRYPTGTVLAAPIIVSHVKQITAALQYAHNRNIIHRDIKPENMLLSDEDTIMLSDFGLSIALRNLHNRNIPSLFSQGTLMAGTTTYMAPEQFSGTPYYASDQYGLATLVYEWFCGTPPFVGSDLQTAVKHMYKEPPLMREIVSALDPAIESVVMRGLAKNPQQRFASVRDFADALEAVCKPISSRLYPLAKELVPSAYSVNAANSFVNPPSALMAGVMDKKPAPSVPDRLPLFSKTLSTPLSPEQPTLMSFRQKPFPLDPETQNLIMKPSVSASIRKTKKAQTIKPSRPVAAKKPQKNLHATEQKVRWILLAIVICCLSGAITVSLISFTQMGLQPVKKQVPIVVTHVPKKTITTTHGR